MNNLDPNLVEQVLQQANALQDGIRAYHANDLTRAIVLLSGVLDVDRKNWNAKIYLALAYYKNGELYTAQGHVNMIREQCPRSEIVKHAETLSKLLHEKIARKTGSQS